MAASGTQEPASAIPWAEVGPGWFVALWSTQAPSDGGGPAPKGSQLHTSTLLLVDPLGGRYQVTVLPAPPDWGMLDWSGDGRRVLISTPLTGTPERYQIEDVDLTTGKVLHHFAVSGTNSTYQYTRPDGLAILASAQSVSESVPGRLQRLSLSGTTELTYPTTFPGVGIFGPVFSSGVLPSLDGTEVVLEAHEGMALVANNGTFVKDVGPTGQSCDPLRWWTATEFVASCQGFSGTATPALWLASTTGRPASQLTFPKSPDLGDLNGWKVGNSVFTQAAGPCGTEFLAVRQPNGRTKAVKVPHAGLDVIVVGAHAGRLALQAKLGCGQATSLFWFSPQTATETPLLGPPISHGTVLATLPYPGLEN